MKKLENLDSLNQDSQETPEQRKMSEDLRKMAESIEIDNEIRHEKKKDQRRLERVQDLRRQIMGMDPQELDTFKEKYLPTLREEMKNIMELNAVNSAVEERSGFFMDAGQRKNKDFDQSISDAEKDLLIKNTEDIFNKVKPPEGIDRIAFAREVLAHESEIQASRSETENLFKEIVGTELTESVMAELQEIIGESALTKEPNAVLKYVANLLAKCGTPFESLSEDQQKKLRDAIIDVSAYAINFTSMKPDVRRIKQMETGGSVDDFGRSKRAGVENPFVDFPEDKEGEEKIEALRRNFDQIGGLTLRKIIERINGIIEEAGSLKDVNDNQKKILANQVKSICNQLGQERWWRARYLTQEQVDKYRDGLLKLPEKIVNEVKERMIAEDVRLKTPFRRAIYNRLFGNYDEDYDKMEATNDQAEKLQTVA